MNTQCTDQTSAWHLDLYIWKAANKTVSIKKFPDKQIELKNYQKNAEPNWSDSSDTARIVRAKAKKLIPYKS